MALILVVLELLLATNVIVWAFASSFSWMSLVWLALMPLAVKVHRWASY